MGEKPDNSKDDQGGPKEKKRLDLSVPQVAGSAVAAVVAAKLASSFGVYGTILGAGVVSALATSGGTLFQHFFKRTGEQIRDVAVQTKPKGRQVPVTAEGRPVPRTFRSDTSMDATKAMVTGAEPPTARPATGAVPTTITWGTPATADAEATTVLPQLSAAEQIPGADDGTQLLDTGAVADLLPDDPEKTQLLRAEAVDQATQVLRPVGEPQQPPLPSDEFTDGTDEFTDGTVHRSRVKSWKRPLIAAAVVFGVTMGGITTYEIVSGHSFSGDSGTTSFREAFTGHRSSGGSDPAPSTSQQPSDDSSTGSDSGTRQDGDGSSTDGNGTPTPTPSGSTGTGSGTGSDSDSGSDSGADSGSGSGSGESGTSPTPTPTPTPSQSAGGAGADTGSGQQQTPAE
ncbi:hypothetical protein [Streptomyces longispororuber]|uniref:hypothetical protein n=1 Tax=Streptomyces longispororuber TaxID=68230 RepID=UPI00210C35D8|nr:hypothetical protein [Streptomyces longispororuber]MCQ4207631.1 hypothetical protein [Streptomyces longispororuber]